MNMELSHDNVLQTLTYASGSERSLDQKRAEAQLKQWEVVPGYHSHLQAIYNDLNNPVQIRWLAIICLKNGIDKYWRSSRQHAIGKEEKKRIIQNSMMLLNESNNQLMTQNANAVAKIARSEFPSEWPTLFDDIMHRLEDSVFRENDLITTNNILIILNRIIKSISSVRIGRSRNAMHSKSPTIVNVLVKLYLRFFNAWTSNSNLTLMQVCYLCLKNLRRIIPEAYDQPHKSPEVCEFLGSSIKHLQLLVMENEKYSSDVLERYVRCYGKMYVAMIDSNPTSFVLLPCSEDIIDSYLNILKQKAAKIYESTDENDFWESLALKGLRILKLLTSFIAKKGTLSLKQKNDKVEVQKALEQLNSRFYDANNLQHLCDLIINWYIRLKASDLESWLLEPEEWCNEEASKSWEYQVRPCAENFFQDLAKYFPEQLMGFILNKLSNGMMVESVDDVLTQDAIWCTFQLSSYSIANDVDFDALLQTVFIPQCMQSNSKEMRILRRRLCLIIKEWVGVKCSSESRDSIYKVLLFFLCDEGMDVVVKLASIQTLKAMIDDWDFSKTQFQPYLNDFVRILLAHFQKLEQVESKLFMLNTLNVLLEKNNPLVDYQLLKNILDATPTFWETVSEPIVKSSILRVLKSLIVSLNENSVEAHPITMPLIRICCTPDTDAYALVSEDGYELWGAVLKYCPLGDQNMELIDLFSLITFGLRNSTEILPLILSNLRSYALYAPELFAQPAAVEPFTILAEYLPQMRDDSFAVFISLMEILLMNPTAELVDKLDQSGLLKSMANYTLDENHSAILASKMFVLFGMFAMSPVPVYNLDTMLPKWLESLSHIGNPRNKKLVVMGVVAYMLQGLLGNVVVAWELFAEIVKKTLYFSEEVNEDSSGNCESYSSNHLYEDIDEYSYLDPTINPPGEKLRYQKLLAQYDFVGQTSILQFLKSFVLELRSNLDEDSLKKLVSSLDTYSLEKLRDVANI
ncbi:uncharacterized protein LODBEIA_P59470 [Lodderomyces beijingensis]|uniref:Importin N-terminal domain-containing protein n=1 Tax=Lodderomyces beijingensis TaxID=1775926 RepID=A0ABP0ZUA4_9ASCO